MFQRVMQNKAIAAVLNIAFGIFLVIARRHALDDLIRIAGYVSIGAGIVYVVYYFTAQSRDQIQLGYAATLAIAGLLLLWLAPAIRNILPILAGILLILVGAGNMAGSSNTDAPAYIRFFPVLIIILGVVILFRPGATMDVVILILGIAMILNGINELHLISKIRQNIVE